MKLFDDSKLIQNLLENDTDNIEETILRQYPTINFELLKVYYASENLIKDTELLKLAEDMNYLDCGKLIDVLIKIIETPLDYSSLNEDLVKEINIEAKKIIKIAAGCEHFVTLTRDGHISTEWYDKYEINLHPTGGGYVSIACGDYHSVALHRDGSLVTWGHNTHSQLEGSPRRSGYIAIACGKHHSVALRKDGSIASWGGMHRQQRNIPTGKDFTLIACGYYHSVALRKDGSLVTWGGAEIYTNHPPPDDYVSIACGSAHFVALRRDGTIVQWGDDKLGQTKNFPPPDQYVTISCGIDNSSAISKDGRLFIWGNPTFISGYKDHIAIESTWDYSISLRKNGGIVTWGYRDDYYRSYETSGRKQYIAVACGFYKCMALNKDGTTDVFENHE